MSFKHRLTEQYGWAAWSVLGIVCWSLLGQSTLAAEEAAPTPVPTPLPLPNQPAQTPPATTSPDRPKIRYWLDDASGPATAPGTAATQSGDTGPAPVVVPSQPEDLCLPEEATSQEALSRRAVLMAEIKCRLQDAKAAFKKGDYERVILIARAIQKADPRNLEAAEWLRKAQGKQFDADEKISRMALDRLDDQKLLETQEHSVTPPPKMPTLRPHFPRRDEQGVSPQRKKMLELLNQRVEMVNFVEADLSYVFNVLVDLTGINLVADPAALKDKQITIQVQDLPLKDILDFIVRNNDGIQYSVSDNAIWVTATAATDLKKIMELRVYPLHHGLVSTQGGGGSGGGSGSKGGKGGGGGSSGGGGGSSGGGKSSGGQEEPSYIETMLKWMKDAKDPQIFPDGSDYLVDRQSNQLNVYTTPSGHDHMRDFLDSFDHPPIQVLIKSRFLEIDDAEQKELGANLQSLTTKNLKLSTAGASTSASTTTTSNVLGPVAGYAFSGATGAFTGGNILQIVGLQTNPQYQIALNALLTNSRTKVLSEPQILAINNKEAYIDVTQEFSYISSFQPTTVNTATQGVVSQSTSGYTPEFDTQDIGFTLHVTPSVGRDLKTINLHLRPEIQELLGQDISSFSSFDAVYQLLPNQAPPQVQRPTIDHRELETDVVVEDNGFVVLGGLVRSQTVNQVKRIPGLYKIPFLGRLFEDKNTSTTRQNLTIIVEAQILTQEGRTYYKTPEVDQVDFREGGAGAAPGQTSSMSDSPNPASMLHVARTTSPVAPRQPVVLRQSVLASDGSRAQWSVAQEEKAKAAEVVEPKE